MAVGAGWVVARGAVNQFSPTYQSNVSGVTPTRFKPTMSTAANIVVGLIALLHIYILVLEMFLWETTRAMKAFGTTPATAATTKVLAANQGLYNGFLAAGLLWGLYLGSAGFSIKVFFCCACWWQGCMALQQPTSAFCSFKSFRRRLGSCCCTSVQTATDSIWWT